MALFSMVGAFVADLFVSGARLYTRAESRLDTQAAALIALTQLSREARASTYASLTVTDEATYKLTACAFRRNVVPPVRSVGTTGSDGFVVYWFDRESSAIGRVEVAKDASVQRLTPTEVVSAAVNAGHAHLIARFVRALTFALPSSDAASATAATYPSITVKNPSLSVSITVCKTATPDPANPEESFNTAICMRNKK